MNTQVEQRRTSQVAVDQELSQLSSILQSRRAKIARIQLNIDATSQHIQAQQTRQTCRPNNIPDRPRYEPPSDDEYEKPVFATDNSRT